MGRFSLGNGPYFFMMESQGTLRYSPKLLGDKSSERWWLVVDCDPSIGAYYRDLYALYHYKCRVLYRPAWREHITVVRDEIPPNKHLWEKYDGEIVTFKYDLCPQTNGYYWWFKIKCHRLLDIREELGLSRGPLVPLHLSFGHTGEKDV